MWNLQRNVVTMMFKQTKVIMLALVTLKGQASHTATMHGSFYVRIQNISVLIVTYSFLNGDPSKWSKKLLWANCTIISCVVSLCDLRFITTR